MNLKTKDNVLIDDKRIHVDFSQSVSKLGQSIPRESEYYGEIAAMLSSTPQVFDKMKIRLQYRTGGSLNGI